MAKPLKKSALDLIASATAPAPRKAANQQGQTDHQVAGKEEQPQRVQPHDGKRAHHAHHHDQIRSL